MAVHLVMAADSLFDRLARALAGRYTLVRELGRGGMATVYLGTDLRLGRQVAIKLLAPATRAYLGSGRFQREVLLAARLSHPHIVALFEADEVDGFLFYVMEYVEGESLEDRLRRDGRLPVEEAVRIATEVGDALQYAHESGVIHRDVKPANILLSHGHAMVSDFGIAKLMEGQRDAGGPSLSGAGTALGTPEYMSPEQASGDQSIDARTDVYSLAAVVYAMLAGAPPFTGPTVQAVVVRVLGEPPRPISALRPGLPAQLERAIGWGLAKAPTDRPATVHEFVARLTAPIPGRPARPVRPIAWIVIGGVVVAAILSRLVLPGRMPAPPGMALVPAGLYPVGGAPWRGMTRVRLDSFFIDVTEVTVAAFQPYLAATGRAPPWTRQPPSRWPVTGVVWTEAAAYCLWRGRRLPTEDEWEAAARGPRGFRYPWGDRWQAGMANADSLRDSFAPVGTDSLGKSWVGAVDLIGNAWEWTATAGNTAQGQPGHIIKGGAFDSPPENASATFRAVLPDRRSWLAHTGFRCARDVSPPRSRSPR